MFLYVHINRRLIRDGSQGRLPRLSHSSRVLGQLVAVNIYVCLFKYNEQCPKEQESDREGSVLFRLRNDNGRAFDWLIQAEVTTQPVLLRPLTAAATMAIDCHCRRRVRAVTAVSWKRLIPFENGWFPWFTSKHSSPVATVGWRNEVVRRKRPLLSNAIHPYERLFCF